MRRRGAVGVNTVKGGEDAIEVTDDEERSRQRGQKREEGLGEELCAACGLSRSVKGQKADGVGVEGEIKAKDAG